MSWIGDIIRHTLDPQHAPDPGLWTDEKGRIASKYVTHDEIVEHYKEQRRSRRERE